MNSRDPVGKSSRLQGGEVPAPGQTEEAAVEDRPGTQKPPPTTLPTGGSPSFPNPPSSDSTGNPVSAPGGYDETEHHKDKD